MSKVVITIDLDWASECAIEETLNFFLNRNYPVTVFATHTSQVVDQYFNKLTVGLHPFFGQGSSHGANIEDVVKHVHDIPHNIKAFRCHRFASCNESLHAMYKAGMILSSNMCTDCAIIAPFKHRSGLIEFPIFIEDGGYLWQQHPLAKTCHLTQLMNQPEPKMLLIHPMHFVLNTPHFSYMLDIKRSLTTKEWQNLSATHLQKLKHRGNGITTFMQMILDHCDSVIGLETWYTQVQASHNLRNLSLRWQNQIGLT